MFDELSASVFCVTPRRVPVATLWDGVPPETVGQPTCSAPPIPVRPCPVCPRLDQEFEPWRQAAYWKSMHQRATAREQLLQQEIQQLQARVRFLEQQCFGRKSEATAAAPTAPASVQQPATAPPRSRGQQPDRPAPKRRSYDHLPTVEEPRVLPEAQQQCPQCGQPLVSFPRCEESTVLEVEVRAHRRLIRRHCYQPTCTCGCQPGIITAPPPPKVIPKSFLGVSVWVSVLLDKYLFYRPTYRLLAEWRTHGFDLALGTVTGGLQQLLPLFEPVYDALVAHSRKQPLWHADETRWLVFATVEGKVGYRWYLWVFHAAEVVVFVLAMGRSHEVPEDQLGPDAKGILVVDRYSAYKAIDQVKKGHITLAFCWAHVRRDFLEVARSWPQLESWGLEWIERIGELYRRNDARLEVLEKPELFAAADQRVREQVEQLSTRAKEELSKADLHPAARRTLESLGDHWTGLTVFVEHPEVPMDNNTAERAERGPVVGRKNYYGSGAVWSGRLASMLFSLLQTLSLWDLNPRAWLTAYLNACAEAGGQAPASGELEKLLPWRLSEAQKQAWSLSPAKEENTS